MAVPAADNNGGAAAVNVNGNAAPANNNGNAAPAGAGDAPTTWGSTITAVPSKILDSVKFVVSSIWGWCTSILSSAWNLVTCGYFSSGSNPPVATALQQVEAKKAEMEAQGATDVQQLAALRAALAVEVTDDVRADVNAKIGEMFTWLGNNDANLLRFVKWNVWLTMGSPNDQGDVGQAAVDAVDRARLTAALDRALSRNPAFAFGANMEKIRAEGVSPRERMLALANILNLGRGVGQGDQNDGWFTVVDSEVIPRRAAALQAFRAMPDDLKTAIMGHLPVPHGVNADDAAAVAAGRLAFVNANPQSQQVLDAVVAATPAEAAAV